MSKTPEKTSRCHHRLACGRRCRKPISAPQSRFCELHQAIAEAQPEPDLSATLTEGLAEFTSAGSINEFLSRLLLLLSENRSSPRRAAVLAYITNQILRTVAVMQQQAATAAAQEPKNRSVNFRWSLPCPPHEPKEPGQLPSPGHSQVAPDRRQPRLPPPSGAARENPAPVPIEGPVLPVGARNDGLLAQFHFRACGRGPA